jgi:hypothetical protein
MNAYNMKRGIIWFLLFSLSLFAKEKLLQPYTFKIYEETEKNRIEKSHLSSQSKYPRTIIAEAYFPSDAKGNKVEFVWYNAAPFFKQISTIDHTGKAQSHFTIPAQKSLLPGNYGVALLYGKEIIARKTFRATQKVDTSSKETNSQSCQFTKEQVKQIIMKAASNYQELHSDLAKMSFEPAYDTKSGIGFIVPSGWIHKEKADKSYFSLHAPDDSAYIVMDPIDIKEIRNLGNGNVEEGLSRLLVLTEDILKKEATTYQLGFEAIGDIRKFRFGNYLVGYRLFIYKGEKGSYIRNVIYISDKRYVYGFHIFVDKNSLVFGEFLSTLIVQSFCSQHR